MSVIQLDRRKGKAKPLYQQISQYLSNSIMSGVYVEGQRLPSVSQMVKDFDVDYRTVMFALEELGNRNLIKIDGKRAHGPIVIQGGTKRLVISYIRWDHDSMSLAFTRGINQYLAESDIECLVVDAHRSYDAYIEAMNHLAENIKGVIVMPFEGKGCEDIINKHIEGGVNVVLIDRNLPGVNASSVSMDNVAGAHEAAVHLFEVQKSPVYYIGLTRSPSSAYNRYSGWRTAMGEYGILDCSKYTYDVYEICGSDLSELSDEEQLRHFTQIAEKLFTENPQDKYSILCCADLVAMGVYKAAERKGLQIGKDVFVVGFGDSAFCERLTVPLSSVNQSNELVGYEAAKFMETICTGEMTGRIQRVLPARLCIRESSKGI
ncbi:Arabinose metabolism transcriptional repressor [Limihaloglobus sulfuriphilus]|uniref:Arabinose metabolism transcriptional repressor n=1 Tax=Limihaloglobus sulfuriphilus TaxID=1851148 RepID=A0A1Q2MGN9_9BACT|nr:substrate-binding domain-containing protein [Limihaloglobus sulfuriphilus]AQQ71477.1 Arabinose metabolism transcriptional repressor [Limihaloglobus sulfuriphilus]